MKMKVRLNALAAAVAGLVCIAGIAEAQVIPLPPALTVPPAQSFPNADNDRVAYHLNRARLIAGSDMYPAFQRRCVMSQIYSQYANSAEAALQIHPQQVFDNLFFVGQGAVTAWAVKTSAGIVLIDSLNNASEAEYILMEGVRKLGLNPADVKYVIITHEHGDHYNGVRYLQDQYGVQAIASDIAWAAMDNGSATRPRRNITIADGQDYAIGDTSFHFMVTPGHTNGGVSMIFPVFDHGERHLGGIYSGWGIPGSATGKATQLGSVVRFAEATKRKGVDVLLANHQTQDMSLYGLDLVKYRRTKESIGHATPNHPGDFIDPHPYIVGKDGFQRFLAVQSECILASAARNGQVVPQ